MGVFEPRYELMARVELEQLQLERTQALLARLRRSVRRYRDKLGDARVESLTDLAGLPFTTPEEMLESFPYGMFAFPLREVIRLHSTLGPQGRPLVIGHTRNDLSLWARLVARQLAAGGVTANDVIQIALGSTVNGGASGYVLGAECIEASVIAEDPLHIDSQLAMLQNYRPTILVTTPTNALALKRVLDQRRLDSQALHLRTLLLSRPIEASLRQELADGFLAAVRCNFGIGEILDPGLCVECESGGFHINEDQFLVEICDGELVVTTLCREAMPLLRYRTRFAAAISRAKCPCGRTGALLEPRGRLDGRLRVNEVCFFEAQIAEVLARTRAAGQRFRIDASGGRMVVGVEMSESLLANALSSELDTEREIEQELLARLGLEAEVRFVEPRRPG
jgi:phenylacetate-CoA ligase